MGHGGTVELCLPHMTRYGESRCAHDTQENRVKWSLSSTCPARHYAPLLESVGHFRPLCWMLAEMDYTSVLRKIGEATWCMPGVYARHYSVGRRPESVSIMRNPQQKY